MRFVVSDFDKKKHISRELLLGCVRVPNNLKDDVVYGTDKNISTVCGGYGLRWFA